MSDYQNTCSRCGEGFRTIGQFDAHPCMTASLDPAATAVLRTRRRTCLVTIGRDTVHLCEPDCRNDVLADLGIASSGNGNYRRAGEADVHIAWNGADRRVSWLPAVSNARPCDLCADQWRYRVPSLVAKARARGEAMKASPTANSGRFGTSPAA
jgi:hypothetical protein